MENRLMQIPSPIIVRLKELDELVAENPEYIPIPAAAKKPQGGKQSNGRPGSNSKKSL